MEEDVGARLRLRGRDVLRFVVTDTAFAGDEDHPRRRDVVGVHGVVAGAGHHLHGGIAAQIRRRADGVDAPAGKPHGRRAPDVIEPPRRPAFEAGVVRRLAQTFFHVVEGRIVGVTEVHAER